MDMDKAPLNRAHQLERKAEVLNRQKKLEECIQCHIEAVELYNKCLQLGDNKQALESIQLQKEWNERQIRTLQLKKSYIERTEKQKKLNKIAGSKDFQKEAIENLEAKIFRNFETHDSLICYLAKRGIIDTPEKHCHSIGETEGKNGSPFIVGNKHPKDDTTIIEELKELSEQLRESVQGLSIQLDERKMQNEFIKERIKSLELDKSYREGLLIQLDDRNKEIEELKAHIKDLELEKSQEESSKENQRIIDSSNESSPSSALDMDELKSLPQLDIIPIPEILTNTFKQFNIPEVNSKLLRKSD